MSNNPNETTDAQTLDSEISTLEAEMADTKGREPGGYWNDEGKQARYRQLLEAKESGGAVPTVDAKAKRRGELETLMGDQHSSYWKGAEAEKLQGEYRNLLDGKESGMPAEAVTITDADVDVAIKNVAGMGEVGAEWANELGRGNARGSLEHGEDVRRSVFAEMGEAAAEVAQAFDGLPDNVRASVHREFATAYVPRLPPADRDDLEQFAQSSAGKILVKEWGGDAARRLAVALYRWDRLTFRLNDDDFDALDDFFRKRLRPQERAAVMRRLAV